MALFIYDSYKVTNTFLCIINLIISTKFKTALGSIAISTFLLGFELVVYS